jgi:hypothetical protein
MCEMTCTPTRAQSRGTPVVVDAVFPTASVLDAFGLTEHPVALQAGEGRTFRSGTGLRRV